MTNKKWIYKVMSPLSPKVVDGARKNLNYVSRKLQNFTYRVSAAQDALNETARVSEYVENAAPALTVVGKAAKLANLPLTTVLSSANSYFALGIEDIINNLGEKPNSVLLSTLSAAGNAANFAKEKQIAENSRKLAKLAGQVNKGAEKINAYVSWLEKLAKNINDIQEQPTRELEFANLVQDIDESSLDSIIREADAYEKEERRRDLEESWEDLGEQKQEQVTLSMQPLTIIDRLRRIDEEEKLLNNLREAVGSDMGRVQDKKQALPQLQTNFIPGSFNEVNNLEGAVKDAMKDEKYKPVVSQKKDEKWINWEDLETQCSDSLISSGVKGQLLKSIKDARRVLNFIKKRIQQIENCANTGQWVLDGAARSAKLPILEDIKGRKVKKIVDNAEWLAGVAGQVEKGTTRVNDYISKYDKVLRKYENELEQPIRKSEFRGISNYSHVVDQSMIEEMNSIGESWEKENKEMNKPTLIETKADLPNEISAAMGIEIDKDEFFDAVEYQEEILNDMPGAWNEEKINSAQQQKQQTAVVEEKPFYYSWWRR